VVGSLSLGCATVIKKRKANNLPEEPCLLPNACPLSCVAPGTEVRVKHLRASPDAVRRLREMGLREEQEITLLTHNTSVICKVCNMRLGLSPDLADTILVEPLPVKVAGS
jgi:Fe2+ transport system protein FeoA